MRKLFCSALILAVVACSKAPVVEVTAAFTTNKDVYQVGEEVFIENTSNVVNDILDVFPHKRLTAGQSKRRNTSIHKCVNDLCPLLK